MTTNDQTPAPSTGSLPDAEGPDAPRRSRRGGGTLGAIARLVMAALIIANGSWLLVRLGQNGRADEPGGADVASLEMRSDDLQELDLRDSYLAGRNLSASNLARADLSGSNLAEVDLTDAILREARLRSVELSGSLLDRADLTDIDLRDARLREVTAVGTRFGSADLSGTDLSGSLLIDVDLSETTIDAATGLASLCWSEVRWPAEMDAPPSICADALELALRRQELARSVSGTPARSDASRDDVAAILPSTGVDGTIVPSLAEPTGGEAGGAPASGDAEPTSTRPLQTQPTPTQPIPTQPPPTKATPTELASAPQDQAAPPPTSGDPTTTVPAPTTSSTTTTTTTTSVPPATTTTTAPTAEPPTTILADGVIALRVSPTPEPASAPEATDDRSQGSTGGGAASPDGPTDPTRCGVWLDAGAHPRIHWAGGVSPNGYAIFRDGGVRARMPGADWNWRGELPLPADREIHFSVGAIGSGTRTWCGALRDHSEPVPKPATACRSWRDPVDPQRWWISISATGPDTVLERDGEWMADASSAQPHLTVADDAPHQRRPSYLLRRGERTVGCDG